MLSSSAASRLGVEMNDKTEQSLTDALRLAAKSAAPYSTAMIGASHLNEAADTIDNLRAQLAEAQRELVAKEAERAGMELCVEPGAPLKAATRVEGLTTKEAWWAGFRAGKGLPADTPRQEALSQLAEAQRDAERWRWLRDHARIFRQNPDMSGNHYWMVQATTTLRGPTLDAAIDAARGEKNGA